ncbi:signal peptidase I [Aquihabitans daechungensis]|uniref:signal peptidase I n=1 Tax=Aquihabitans daechungensis TaxID=1052257 RepID=UPI003BA2D2ED
MTPEPTEGPPTASDPDPTDGVARRRQREEAGSVPDGSAADGEEPAGDGSGEDLPKKAKPPKSQTRNLLEWVAVIGGAILIAVIVRTFLLQTFWIPSPSMSPTLVENDRVLVNKLAYRFHDVNRGDVIVFERPPTEQPSEIKDLIKRVVGLPGERVSIMDGKVSIDGRPLEEPYTHGLETVLDSCPITYVPGIDTKAGYKIPEDHLLVLGDNRVNSHDGRCFGAIDEDLVVGRAFFLMWPPGHAGGL